MCSIGPKWALIAAQIGMVVMEIAKASIAYAAQEITYVSPTYIIYTPFICVIAGGGPLTSNALRDQIICQNVDQEYRYVEVSLPLRLIARL